NFQFSIFNSQLIDDVLVSSFRAPHSFTGEDTVEISCHGSIYIQKKIVELLIENGAKMATAGEFTQRAFLNGKIDLSQAEAVADLIQSENEASQRLAMKQLRGDVSNKIKELREQLLDFSVLLELELDFSEEDVEFADRKRLKNLLQQINSEVEALLKSFKSGNAVKNGILVTIIGAPNVGKSTLLNALLNDDRALVSEIPGTTRDTVEDEITLNGTKFRFIDTAGIRETDDYVEALGIKRSLKAAKEADVILLVVDGQKTKVNKSLETTTLSTKLISLLEERKDKKVLIVNNKIDLQNDNVIANNTQDYFGNELLHNDDNFSYINISAKQKIGIEDIIIELIHYSQMLNSNNTLISNVRHFEALQNAKQSLEKVCRGFEQHLPSDLIAIDVKYVSQALASIVGAITTENILGEIFGKFCIGK
ncbi:MAG: tRNA uridine-5-carboxymethylaminomethyl(34) synthesis GTPase MnmE, partial [Bacteroidales bacterium]|nr:tRNA uridine-5-carboxymethylaminomethyl(34) synthesis GTPase MnmE [Bacteroidales bacterium]